MAARLQALTSFASEIPRLSWFAAVGEPLLISERREAEGYLAAIGMAGRPLLPVGGWREAAEAASAPDWDPAWWSWEEGERRRLHVEAAAALGEAALLKALEAVTQQATSWLLGAASLAAARSGIADPLLARVAAGAACQAAFQAALALAAGAGQDHAFALKLRLYAAGRWPLAVTLRGFYVF